MARRSPCFLVLAHRQPGQAARLVGALAPHPVLLHVDARARVPAWSEFCRLVGVNQNVTLAPRVRSGWASWGLVQATLNGIELYLKLGCSHLVRMSGEDYPLRPPEHIAAF